MDRGNLAKEAARKTRAGWWHLTRGFANALGLDAESQAGRTVYEMIAWHIEAHLMTGDDTEFDELDRLCSNPACETFKYGIGEEVCWYRPKDITLAGLHGMVRGMLPIGAEPHYYVEFTSDWSQLVREAELRFVRVRCEAPPDEESSSEMSERHTSLNFEVTASTRSSGDNGQDDAPEMDCREGTANIDTVGACASGKASLDSAAMETEAAVRGCASTKKTVSYATAESDSPFRGCASTKTSVSSVGTHGSASPGGWMSAQASECSGFTYGDTVSGGQRGAREDDVRPDRQHSRRMRSYGQTYWEMRVKAIRPDLVGMDVDTYELLYGDLPREPAPETCQSEGPSRCALPPQVVADASEVATPASPGGAAAPAVVARGVPTVSGKAGTAAWPGSPTGRSSTAPKLGARAVLRGDSCGASTTASTIAAGETSLQQRATLRAKSAGAIDIEGETLRRCSSSAHSVRDLEASVKQRPRSPPMEADFQDVFHLGASGGSSGSSRPSGQAQVAQPQVTAAAGETPLAAAVAAAAAAASGAAEPGRQQPGQREQQERPAGAAPAQVPTREARSCDSSILRAAAPSRPRVAPVVPPAACLLQPSPSSSSEGGDSDRVARGVVPRAAGTAATPDAGSGSSGGSGGSGDAAVHGAATAEAAEAAATAEESARHWRLEAEALRKEVMVLRGREAAWASEVKRLQAENAALRAEAGHQASEAAERRRQLGGIESWERAVRRDVDSAAEDEGRTRTAECLKLQEHNLVADAAPAAESSAEDAGADVDDFAALFPKVFREAGSASHVARRGLSCGKGCRSLDAYSCNDIDKRCPGQPLPDEVTPDVERHAPWWTKQDTSADGASQLPDIFGSAARGRLSDEAAVTLFGGRKLQSSGRNTQRSEGSFDRLAIVSTVVPAGDVDAADINSLFVR